MYGSEECCLKHQRGHGVLDTSNQCNGPPTTILYGFDNIGDKDAFLARSPIDTVMLLLARLNEDIAWLRKKSPRMSIANIESEAWVVMKMQVAYAYQTQFVMGALITVMGHLEAAIDLLRWATDFMLQTDMHLSPHLRNYNNFVSDGGLGCQRGVSFMPSFRRGALIMRAQCQRHISASKAQISGNSIDFMKTKLEHLALMYRVLYGHHQQEGDPAPGSSSDVGDSEFALETLLLTSRHYNAAVSEACGALGSWANSLHPMELESFDCGLNPLNLFQLLSKDFKETELGINEDIVDYIFSSFGCNRDLMNGHEAPHSKVNRWALGAQFYRKAAEYAFDDAALKETYWWGAASCMVQTGAHRDDYGTGPWTMGELRAVVNKARLAQQTLDTTIHINQQKMHARILESVAFHVLNWFENEEDSFPIPQCRLPIESGEMFSCVTADGTTLSADVSKESTEQTEMFAKMDQNRAGLDNSAAKCSSSFVDEFKEYDGGIPRLDWIALRKLHKSGKALNCDDPSEIFEFMLMKGDVEEAEEETSRSSSSSVDIDPMSFCALCGAVPKNQKLMRCSGCKSVKYCSKSCQLLDWKMVAVADSPHRLFCKEIKRQKGRGGGGEKVVVSSK